MLATGTEEQVRSACAFHAGLCLAITDNQYLSGQT
jgi:hypothetical protein